MNKKNICFFCGDLSRGGGTEKITSIISREFTKYYNVFIVDIMNVNKNCYFDFSLDIEIIHIPQYISRFTMIKKIIDLTKILSSKKIDIIINVDIMLIMYSFLPARLTNTKIISWEQFNYYNDIGSSNTNKIRQFCLKYTDYYINLTKQDMEVFKDKFEVKVPITYIYNPVEKLQKSPYKKDSKCLITVGNFYFDKGYDLAIQIGELIFKKHPDWKWYFCGDGVEYQSIKDKIEKSTYKDNFVCTGRVNDVDRYMKEAALYISTSRVEGFGLVLIEAQNNSLPVVAFDVPFGPSEIVLNDTNGYLIRDLNIKTLADKVIFLIENQNLREEFSKHSKDKFEEYKLTNIVKQWNSVVRDL